MGEIEIGTQLIAGCNVVTNYCELTPGTSIQTRISIKGTKVAKVQKQQITLVDSITREQNHFGYWFCGVSGKPDCHLITDELEVFEAWLPLPLEFSMCIPDLAQ
ncbi:hypothetical protein MXB_1834 [Myxobolus squamalis]|nr:hypothetical protein MXB_1834 [Myxobolus squamalis]